MARSRVSCRPKLLLPSEPSRSFSVLKSQKIDGLVGDFKARLDFARSRSRPWPTCRAAFCREAEPSCCGIVPLMYPSSIIRSISWSIRSLQFAPLLWPESSSVSSSIMSSGSRSPSCERAQDRLAQRFHRFLGIQLGDAVDIAIRSRSAGRNRTAASSAPASRRSSAGSPCNWSSVCISAPAPC